MSRVLVYGERISNFLLRDSAFLGIDPTVLKSTPPSPEPKAAAAPSQPRPLKEKSKEKSKTTSKSKDKSATTVIAPSAPVEPSSQLNWIGELFQSYPSLKDPLVAHTEAKSRREDGLPPKTGTFRFPDLPPEIRKMIYEHVFTITSGQKPKFLHAVQGNKLLHGEAYPVFCATNNFTISLRQGLLSVEEYLKKGVESLPIEDISLVKHVTIAVPKDLQQSTPFKSKVTLHAKVLDLTLSVSSPNSLRIAAFTIIPSFKHIHTLTVVLRNPHRLADQRKPDRIAHMNSFRDALAAIDRIVDVKGRKVIDSNFAAKVAKCQMGKKKTKQIWIWRAEKGGETKQEGKHFEMKMVKKHVKFD